MSIQTSRDLYMALADLPIRHSSCERGLEEYLRALWDGARRYRERPSLSSEEFFGLLATAFTQPAPSFDEAWRSRYCYEGNEANVYRFEDWEALALQQVVDLREMAEQGMLEDKQRYFGLDSPRGQRWYNFDPCAFLECATAGCYSGWDLGDGSERDPASGPIAVSGEEGEIVMCDPRDLPTPLGFHGEVSWDDFRAFLSLGQLYE